MNLCGTLLLPFDHHRFTHWRSKCNLHLTDEEIESQQKLLASGGSVRELVRQDKDQGCFVALGGFCGLPAALESRQSYLSRLWGHLTLQCPCGASRVGTITTFLLEMRSKSPEFQAYSFSCQNKSAKGASIALTWAYSCEKLCSQEALMFHIPLLGCVKVQSKILVGHTNLRPYSHWETKQECQSQIECISHS